MTDTIDNVLAATDLSRAAFAAVRRAALIAKAQGARLELLHVISHSFASQAWNEARASVGTLETDLGEAAQRDLDALIAQIESEIGIRAHGVIAHGKPYAAISARCAAVHADLVVVGAHGENVLLTPWLGTTAHRVLAEAHVPVLLVKQTPAVEAGEVSRYRRIVVATDFSADAAHAARHALALFPDAEVALFNACEVPFEAKLTRTVASSTLKHYRDLAAEQAQDDMDGFAVVIGAHHAVRTVRHGPPGVRVVEYAGEYGADLIVAGAEEKSRLRSAMLGSVSLHLVTHAQCDVLLGRSPPGAASRSNED